MQIYTGVYWSVGTRHRYNQDSLSLQHILLPGGECLLAVVCDGIGSLQAAEEAGSIVASGLTDWFYHEGKDLIHRKSSKENILLALEGQISKIQEFLKQFQQKEHIQTGTTCSCILILQKRYYLIHIGDSRIYQIRKSKNPFLKHKYNVQCLTRDDCDSRGYLRKALGLSGTDRAVYETGRMRKKTAFLVCTDGFYVKSDERIIGNMLGALLDKKNKRQQKQLQNQLENQLERRLEMLGNLGRQQGSRDDMAAIGVIVK